MTGIAVVSGARIDAGGARVFAPTSPTRQRASGAIPPRRRVGLVQG
jgi:hypothetical protein